MLILDSITVEPARVPPGGTARVTVVAHDTSMRELLLEGPGIDQSTGERVPMSVRVSIGAQPIRFRPRPPARGTLTPDPVLPNVFIYTAEPANPVPPPHPH